ncbi:winged helix-turn-helix domain-containing protein [Streptomyces sp. MS1.AVA.1]|uniref:Winged helix-turn-helix domain-containing protein n=1 Tax=Streptomyces machairae TaxID=3134109 RepID=A0ABU8UFA0_9ACTN
MSGEAGRLTWSRGRPAHGRDQDRVWTGARAVTLIGRKFHVSCSVSGATRLTRRIGFTPQVPAGRVTERDEKAVTSWKEVTWAEVDHPGGLRRLNLLRGRSGVRPQAADRTYLGTARRHPGP